MEDKQVYRHSRYGFSMAVPKAEGMKIPKKMVEDYGFGVGINYPFDDFISAYKDEFGKYPEWIMGEPSCQR